MDGCIFCRFVRGEAEPYKLWEDSAHMAFLDINPINPGHVDVIPKRHVSDILDMGDAEYSELLLTAKKLAVHLKRVTGAKRIGFAVEGFGVPHVHVHLVPVNNGMELDPNRGEPATDAELEAMLARLKAGMPEI